MLITIKKHHYSQWSVFWRALNGINGVLLNQIYFVVDYNVDFQKKQDLAMNSKHSNHVNDGK